MAGTCAAQVVRVGLTTPTEVERVMAEFDSQDPSTQDVTPRLDAGSQTRPATRIAFPSTAAATQPEAASAAAGNFPAVGGSFGLGEFIQHFAPYEPMYFIGGWRAPQVKFQFSIRYRIITPNGPLATRHPWLGGFNFAYSQTSFWDWSDTNSPFFYDSSYRPEFFYYLQNVPKLNLPPAWQLGAQVGIGHESNGQRPPNHRSLNIAFIRPIFTVSQNPNGFFVTVAPKIYYYIGDLGLNPDIKRYRGFADIRFVVGMRDGLQLATVGRVGDHGDRGSAQFDLTYPLTKIFNGNTDLCLDAQYFNGYGESLLSYNKRTQVFRVGFSLVR